MIVLWIKIFSKMQYIHSKPHGTRVPWQLSLFPETLVSKKQLVGYTQLSPVTSPKHCLSAHTHTHARTHTRIDIHTETHTHTRRLAERVKARLFQGSRSVPKATFTVQCTDLLQIQCKVSELIETKMFFYVNASS